MGLAPGGSEGEPVLGPFLSFWWLLALRGVPWLADVLPQSLPPPPQNVPPVPWSPCSSAVCWSPPASHKDTSHRVQGLPNSRVIHPETLKLIPSAKMELQIGPIHRHWGLRLG